MESKVLFSEEEQSGRRYGQAASKLKLTCSHCRKPGLEAAQCWQLHPELRQNKANTTSKKTKIIQEHTA
jgi:hypothetical protein